MPIEVLLVEQITKKIRETLDAKPLLREAAPRAGALA